VADGDRPVQRLKAAEAERQLKHALEQQALAGQYPGRVLGRKVAQTR
jgi:hypothetical protein